MGRYPAHQVAKKGQQYILTHRARISNFDMYGTTTNTTTLSPLDMAINGLNLQIRKFVFNRHDVLECDWTTKLLTVNYFSHKQYHNFGLLQVFTTYYRSEKATRQLQL